MTYKLVNITKEGNQLDITTLVSEIHWSSDINQAARQMEITMAFGGDYYLPKYDVPLGSLLILFNDAVEIIRTVVFNKRKDTGGGHSVTGYDHLNYLLKSKGTFKFRKMTATAIIKEVCAAFNIPVGDMAETGVVLDKQIFREDQSGSSLYDICMTALKETTKRNGKKYVLRMRQGKLQVIEKPKQTVRWLLTGGSNLISADYGENIEEMKNRILVVGDKDQVLARVENPALIKRYGLLQEVATESSVKAGEARTIAQNMLKELGKVSREARIECLGIDEVEAGTAIEVRETLTGLIGIFYVDTDKHTISNGQHTMNLTLNWTDEVSTDG